MDQPETIIFDFDGTLADTFLMTLDIIYQFTHHRQLPAKADISRLRSVSLLTAISELNVPWWRSLFLLRRVRRIVAERIREVELIPGTAELLGLLAKDYRLFVVSSNSTANVQAVLKRYRLESCFSGVYGGVNPWRKQRTLHQLADTYRLRVQSTWYVGDENWDIQAAHNQGMRSAAVTWGFSNPGQLKRKHPEVLVFNPDELIGRLEAYKPGK